MRRFNHVGLPTDQPQPRETYVRETKVWVTRPNDHPQRIEFLRFEADSPVTGPLRDGPHIAFVVEDLAAALAGEEGRVEVSGCLGVVLPHSMRRCSGIGGGHATRARRGTAERQRVSSWLGLAARAARPAAQLLWVLCR
jgi:hypothetical protein